MSSDLIRTRARAFDRLFSAVVVIDREGRILDWNVGATKLYGYEPEEALGRPVRSILHGPDDVDRSGAELLEDLQGRDFWTGEVRRRAKDRSVVWVESVVTPLTDEEGVTLGAVVNERDITARKLAETELRTSEARWRAVFNGSADAIVISDEEGRIQQANPRTEALFGYDRNELIGESIEILIPPNLRERHVEHRRKFEADPSSRRPMSDRTDLVGKHRDGHTIPLSIGLSVMESTGQRWTVAIVHDLTRQYALTERLRLLSAALEASANGIAITDTKGVCHWINSGFETITGYSNEEIVGRRVSVLNSGVHDNEFFRDLWDTITAGRSWHGEIHNRHRDGHVYVEEQTISPVRGAAGEITHFVAVKQDVTARRKMEQKLRDTNETLQEKLDEIESLQAKLREQAVRDPLTGLFNRRHLRDFLEPELARSRREGYPVAFVLLDIDHFKRINDTYGHGAGDATLCAVADLLRERTREADTTCRFGGEEFIVVMPGANASAATARANALREAYEQTTVEWEGSTIRTTLSAGVAVFPDNGGDADAVMSAADEALYEAKARGRNRVVGLAEEERRDRA